MRPHAGKTGCVYFVQAEIGGPIKIGFTQGKPEVRLKALQTGSPFKLVLLKVIPKVTREQEWELHRRFSAYRLHGEWFREDGLELADELGIATIEERAKVRRLAIRSLNRANRKAA